MKLKFRVDCQKNLDVDGVIVAFLEEICLTGDFLRTLPQRIRR